MEDEKIDSLVMQVDEKDVPSLIQGQFTIMSDLKKNLEVVKQKASDADIQAQKAKDQKTGFFKMKGTIESIQETQISLSEATMKNALALEKTFEYQQRLAEITKYLFELGITNITMNRCVVQELEMRLNNASEEEIDEMARNELKDVVKKLKAQEDISKKQTDLSIKLKEAYSRILELENRDNNKNSIIEELKNNLDNSNNSINKLKFNFKITLGASIGLGIISIIALILAIIGI